MNERIKGLLTPKLKEWGGASGDNFSEELEKFAELIVRECAKFCDDKNSKLLGTMMKEHFGVEE